MRRVLMVAILIAGHATAHAQQQPPLTPEPPTVLFRAIFGPIPDAAIYNLPEPARTLMLMVRGLPLTPPSSRQIERGADGIRESRNVNGRKGL